MGWRLKKNSSNKCVDQYVFLTIVKKNQTKYTEFDYKNFPRRMMCIQDREIEKQDPTQRAVFVMMYIEIYFARARTTI